MVRPGFLVAAVALALGPFGCRGCEERYQQRVAREKERDGVCYAMPRSEAAAEVRAELSAQGFPLPVEAPADSGIISTGWKDKTVNASRVTFQGRPARVRAEVLLAGRDCLRFAVHAISQSTPKGGPDYADTISGSYEEDGLTEAIHERLKAHARPWPPPP